MDLDAELVYWSDRVTLPYRPHIGTLSTTGARFDQLAHARQPRREHGPARHGPGSVTYLPVRTAGARLFIGDADGRQGDGEVCGTAVEYASLTTIHVDVIKGWTIDWPWLENDEVIMAIGSARPLEDAARIAYRELIYWMERDYGFDRWDADTMLSQCWTGAAGTSSTEVHGRCGHSQDLPRGRLNMDLGLHGLNAIVTGATRGIGRAIAETLADEG